MRLGILSDTHDALVQTRHTGHSHIASDRREGLVRRINPGAVHEADRLSVALLDLDVDELQLLELPREGAG